MMDYCLQLNEPKDKLIKWYGWIFILFLCLTPLVFILLPILMYNVGYFNKMLKNSKISQEVTLQGILLNCNLNSRNIDGLNAISGELVIISQGNRINCSFLKYTKKGESVPSLESDSNVDVSGTFDREGIFKVASIVEKNSGKTYSTLPTVSVY